MYKISVPDHGSVACWQNGPTEQAVGSAIKYTFAIQVSVINRINLIVITIMSIMTCKIFLSQ